MVLSQLIVNVSYFRKDVANFRRLANYMCQNGSNNERASCGFDFKHISSNHSEDSSYRVYVLAPIQIVWKLIRTMNHWASFTAWSYSVNSQDWEDEQLISINQEEDKTSASTYGSLAHMHGESMDCHAITPQGIWDLGIYKVYLPELLERVSSGKVLEPAIVSYWSASISQSSHL